MKKNEDEIRAIIREQITAIQNKNVDGALRAYSEEVVSFDVVDPLEYKGLKVVRKRLEEWFSSFKGTIDFEITALEVTASEDIAFSQGLNHVSANTTQGTKLDMYYRQTLCFEKENGNWKITHAHSSVPFNVESGKASLDLKP